MKNKDIQMMDWIENSNGNYVCTVGESDLMTVYKNTNGKWSGRYEDMILKIPHENPAEAMNAMERFVDGAEQLMQKINIGWGTSKRGGYFIQSSRGIFCVKQAKSGKWYITHNGELLKNLWLDKRDEAIKRADAIIS